MAGAPKISVGIGGWSFAPWRGGFYPDGLAQKRELEYASRKLTAIEINATYYGAQKPESFARWGAETPDDFVFAVKGSRFTTNRRVLAEAGPSIEKFFATGVLELKDKLGPVNWQFATTKTFDPADFEAFLKLLPKRVEGREIRHVVEVRHGSFAVPAFVDLLREYGVAAAFADKPGWPSIPDVTAPFAYARLQGAEEAIETGYPAPALVQWAQRAAAWRDGGMPADLPPVGAPDPAESGPRDVFVFFINGFKPKAPAAAMGLIAQLGQRGV